MLVTTGSDGLVRRAVAVADGLRMVLGDPPAETEPVAFPQAAAVKAITDRNALVLRWRLVTLVTESRVDEGQIHGFCGDIPVRALPILPGEVIVRRLPVDNAER